MHYVILALGNYKEYIGRYKEYDGDNSELAQHISILAEAQDRYYNQKVKRYVTPTGEIIKDHFDPILYRMPTKEEEKRVDCRFASCSHGNVNGKPYVYMDWDDNNCQKLRFLEVPEGWEEKELTYNQFLTFREFCRERYAYPVVRNKNEIEDLNSPCGYILIDKKGNIIDVVEITNPNGHYDYWQVTGRFDQSIVNKRGKPSPIGKIKDICVETSHIFGIVTPDFWIDRYERKGYQDSKEYWNMKETCVWDSEIEEILKKFPPDTPYTLLDCHS